MKLLQAMSKNAQVIIELNEFSQKDIQHDLFCQTMPVWAPVYFISIK